MKPHQLRERPSGHVIRAQPGQTLSRPDWPAAFRRILSLLDEAELSRGTSVDITYGIVDPTGRYEQGLWSIRDGRVQTESPA